MDRVPAKPLSPWVPVLENEIIQTYLNYFDNEFDKTMWKSCFDVINEKEMELILERTIEEGERIENLDLLRFRNLSEKDLHVIIQRCPNLKVLHIHSDEIRILPILPDGLTSLHCKNSKKLEGFLNLPDSLRYIDCDGCPIKVFPMLPNDLRCLSCQGTDLPSGALPENLPRNLAYIPCSGSGVLIEERTI